MAAKSSIIKFGFLNQLICKTASKSKHTAVLKFCNAKLTDMAGTFLGTLWSWSSLLSFSNNTGANFYFELLRKALLKATSLLIPAFFNSHRKRKVLLFESAQISISELPITINCHTDRPFNFQFVLTIAQHFFPHIASPYKTLLFCKTFIQNNICL